MATEQDYANMQIGKFESSASESRTRPGVMITDHVVGSFHQHNSWKDYQDYLFRHSKFPSEAKNFLALDFACGPGRNIVLFKDKFQQIDGVDLSENNLSNARVYTSSNSQVSKFFKCNGLDLREIPSESYDVVFSTIALQHICCHSIRLNYFKEFHRILNPGGFLCIQQGFGERYPSGATAVPYYANIYNSQTTGGGQDTQVNSAKQIEDDLLPLGFKEFEFHIRPPGPGDVGHPNWIFWSCQK